MTSNEYPLFLDDFDTLNQNLINLLSLEARYEEIGLDYRALLGLELDAPLKYMEIISQRLEATMRDMVAVQNEMKEIPKTSKDDLFRLRTTGNGVIIQTANEVRVLKKAKEMGSYPFYVNYLANNPEIPAIREESARQGIKACVATPYTPPNPDDLKRIEEDQEVAMRSKEAFNDHWRFKKD